MRQGVPFIAPRQLGAVENTSGRLSLPSVVGRTGQSGAHRTLSGARFLSLTGAADRCRPLQIWRTGQSAAHRTVRCCLVYSSMRQGVPFIAPRQLGAVENTSGRLSLPSVVGRTGQSGAHRTLSGARFLSLTGAADRCRPLQIWRTGQSAAHRTVRCFLPTVGSATCRAAIARPTVGPADRWLTRQSGAHRTVR